MKNITKILILFALLLPAGAFAQLSFSLGATGGYTAPTGDIANYFNSGYNVGAEAELEVAGNDFYADVNYNSLSTKDAALNPKALNITELSVGYRRDLFSLGVGSRVFVDAGAGLYSVSAYNTGSVFTPVIYPSSSNFGVNGGIGAAFPLSASTRFIGKIKYHNIIDNVGGNKNLFTVSAGINFKLY